MKWLMWLALILLVYFALRSRARRNQIKRSRANSPKERSAAPVDVFERAENMVACHYCQMYLPASEAIKLVINSSDHYFCCEEHAKLNSETE